MGTIRKAAAPVNVQIGKHQNELRDQKQPKDGQQAGFEAG